MLDEIKRLKTYNYPDDSLGIIGNKIKLQGIKETVEAVDDVIFNKPDSLKEAALFVQSWQQIKEELK